MIMPLRERPRCAVRSHRAWALMIFGSVYVLIGVQFLQVLDQVNAAVAPAYKTHFQIADLRTWAWVFIFVGVVAILAALFYLQALGFSILMALSSFWGLLFVATWITVDRSRAGTQVLQWALITALLLLLSGWRDPAPIPKVTLAQVEAATASAQAVLDQAKEDRS